MRKAIIPFFITACFSGVVTAENTGKENNNKSDLDRIAFEKTIRAVLPLDVKHIIKFKEERDKVNKATNYSINPTLRNKTKNITLKPGAETSVLSLMPNYVTTLVFVDSTGAPWPITSSTVGNAGWFSVVKPQGLIPGNLLTVNPLENHVRSNIVLTLAGHPSPVVIQLESDVSKTDKRVKTDVLISYRIDERGPNALMPTIKPSIASPVSEDLISFLDNVPPEKSVLLKSNGNSDIKIWSYNNRMYFRSPYNIQWPAWSREVRSYNTQVYEIPLTSSVVISINGKQTTINIEEGK